MLGTGNRGVFGKVSMCGQDEIELSRDGSHYSLSNGILPSLGAKRDRRIKLRAFILSPYDRRYRFFILISPLPLSLSLYIYIFWVGHILSLSIYSGLVIFQFRVQLSALFLWCQSLAFFNLISFHVWLVMLIIMWYIYYLFLLFFHLTVFGRQRMIFVAYYLLHFLFIAIILFSASCLSN